ncbi:3'-5' exonuclease [Paenibacillus polymyxa]|uniref:3'-5' exonuclease n=1 Tax=Paenibacillus polymyxa TaxID=1406 RepID=UPI00202501D6|nr:3'-5' exonuclease [Paenibacillus polymyxa]URJ47244.1 3'-5' exonuclease [Paenibacillus polymyxa]
MAKRTCKRCEETVPKQELLRQGLCEFCREQVYLDQCSDTALTLFNSWIERKSEYIILDVKTTGLDGDSEIVEIAIIDLNENPLFETLIKPVSLIPEEATAIHGITNEMVENAPSWPEAWNLIQDILCACKIILIYSADF